METSFAEIVEEVKGLSAQEKQELHGLIEKYLIEERREEICESYAHSLVESNDGKIEFSSDTDKLKRSLSND